MRSGSGSSQFRGTNSSHYKNFLKANKAQLQNSFGKSESKKGLYDFIKQDGNRVNQSVVLNPSHTKTIPQNNYFESNMNFKPKSALKSPLVESKNIAKNVSFNEKPLTGPSRVNASSSYLALRNKGYLTSDILGNKNLDPQMLKFQGTPERGQRPEIYKHPNDGSPMMYRSKVARSSISLAKSKMV